MLIRGTAKKNIKTKALITHLTSNDIAVINHKDIDGVAARQLVDKKIKAVINATTSISGKYPNRGPRILSNAGVPIIDNVGQDIFDKISNYDSLEINDKYLSVNGKSLCEITYLTKDDIESKMDKAASNLWNILDSFIENTLDYAKRKRN